MLSQIRPGQTSPEQGPFLLLMARATIMVIDVSPACRSSVTFYVQKKCFGPFALLCPCVPVLGQEGSRFPLPRIHGRECCFFKDKGRTKPSNQAEEQTHVGARCPCTCGCFLVACAEDLPLDSCSFHPQSLTISVPGVLCRACVWICRTPSRQSIPFPPKDVLLRSGGLGEHGLSLQHLPSKPGCSLDSMAGAGELSTAQSRARLGSAAARLLSWALCLCTDLSFAAFTRRFPFNFWSCLAAR